MSKALIGFCLLAVSASAFSAVKAAPSDPLAGANRNDCFSARFAKDRRVLDNKHLIVWANRTTPYLVELDRPLQYLDSGGHSITFIDGDGDGQVCRTLRDAIVVADTLLSKRRTVVGVTSLDEAQIQVLEEKYKTSLARKKRGQFGQ